VPVADDPISALPGNPTEANPTMLLFADNDTEAIDGAGLDAPSMAPLASLYHLNAKFTRDERAVDPDARTSPEHDGDGAENRFDGLPRLVLAAEPAGLAMSVGEAVRRRRSARDFTGAAIGSSALGTLLQYSAGIVGSGAGSTRGATPSGGGKYPVDLFPCVYAVDGVAPGVYGYDAHTQALVALGLGAHACQAITAACVQPEVLEGVAVVFLIVASLTRSTRKYRERGYRLALQEAGHVAQNLTLAATALGLGSIVFSGFDEPDVERLLDLDGMSETMLGSVVVGHEATRPEPRA
jgi:SagB-type dehydrogenase family enzyme